MQLDKNALDRLLMLDDGTLWKTILLIASTNGIKLPSTPPPAEDFARLRAALQGTGGAPIDVGGAMGILDKYRQNQK